MKVKLSVKHRVGVCPGSWDESTLVLALTDDRDKVERVERAIKDALNDKGR